MEWLERSLPNSRERIEHLVRATHGGKLNNSQFGQRMRGSGEIAEQIRRLFRVFAVRYHLDGDLPEYNRSAFRPPQSANGQMWMF